jgi:hypothetical protein
MRYGELTLTARPGFGSVWQTSKAAAAPALSATLTAISGQSRYGGIPGKGDWLGQQFRVRGGLAPGPGLGGGLVGFAEDLDAVAGPRLRAARPELGDRGYGRGGAGESGWAGGLRPCCS